MAGGGEPGTSDGPDAPGYRRDVQGLRAVAVVAVVLYHASGILPGGFTGVDVFFVISGFVITAMLLREWDAAGRISLRRFYGRRFVRLVPALAAMVVVVALASTVLLTPFGAQQDAAATGLGAMLLGANFVLQRVTAGYFAVDAEVNPFLHTWSLSVEEQIYLVLPVVLIVALLAGRGRRSRTVAIAVVAAFAAVSFAVTVFPAGAALLPATFGGFYGPVPRVWAFGAGALVALLPRLALPRRGSAVLGAAGGAMLIVGFALLDPGITLPGLGTLLPILGTTLLLVAGRQANPVSGLLARRPLVVIGDGSYGWYLWHWPLIVFATLLAPGSWFAPLAGAAIGLALGLASSRWIEQPLRRRTWRGRAAKARLVGATLVPALAATCAVLAVSGSTVWPPPVLAMRDAVVASHPSVVGGCGGELERDRATRTTCEWNTDAAGRPLYLVGDSNATHFSAALLAVAERLVRPVTSVISSGCPPLRVALEPSFRDAAWVDRCADFATEAIEGVADAEPGLVVLSFTSLYWEDPSFQLAEGDRAVGDSAAKLARFGTELETVVGRWLGAGHDVLLVDPVPRLPWNPHACTTLSVSAGTCDVDVAIEELTDVQQEAWRITERVAADSGASVWRPQLALCPEGVCRVVAADGTVMYRDGGHLSVPGAEALIEELLEAVRAAD